MNIAWPNEVDWHLGVSGSRYRIMDGEPIPTHKSQIVLAGLLHAAVEHGAKYLHQGCCTGWDEAAVRICDIDKLDLLIYAHPPEDQRHFSQFAQDHSNVVYKPKTYRQRNIDIASWADIIFVGAAHPETDERSTRSGTWQTARLGRRLGARLYAVDQQGDMSDVTEAPGGTA